MRKRLRFLCPAFYVDLTPEDPSNLPMLLRSCFLCSLLAVLCLTNVLPVQAQFMTGYRLDRFIGVQTTFLQPAALAGNPLRLDLQLGGGDFLLWNSYVGLRRQTVRDSSFFQMEDLDPMIVPENLNGRFKQVYLGSDVHLPGVAFRLGPQLGIGLYGRYRTLLSLDRLGEPGARFAYYDRDVEEQFGLEYQNDQLRFTLASFLEIGLGAGFQVWQSGPHRLKAGVNLKANAPVFGAYLYAERLTYRFDNEDTLDILDTRMETGRSTLGGEPIPYTQLPDRLPQPQFSQLGWGLDLGLLYERQDSAMEAQGFPYRWRAGLALTDLGQVNFERNDDLAVLEGQALDLPVGFWDANSIAFFDSTLSDELNVTRDGSDFSLRLPLSLGLHGDYRFTPTLALQWDLRAGLWGAGVPNAFRPPFTATLVPRWEREWLSVGLPMTVDGQNQFALGTVLRLGPLTIGSGNVLGYFLADNIRSVDVFATLHVPIPYRERKPREPQEQPPREKPPIIAEAPRDTLPPQLDTTAVAEAPEPDTLAQPTQPLRPSRPEPRDTVKVALPEPTPPQRPTLARPVLPLSPRPAPSLRLTVRTEAVPVQRDFPPMGPIPPEHLRDEPDEPVVVAPPVERDEPRIDVSKLTEEEIAEIEAREMERLRQQREQRNQPRPTRPNPARPQPSRNVGQPYRPTDNTLYGSGTYAQYMPYADPDEDGVPNQDDECPDEPGRPGNRGCPEDDPRGKSSSERAPERPTVEAFERVYFDYDEAYLNGQARVSLNQVAGFLRKNPEADLEIWGHADAQGSNPYNDRLSARRCQAVQDYLVSKGIAAERLTIMPVGERLPLASNATEEGRERNRRVELVLVDR